MFYLLTNFIYNPLRYIYMYSIVRDIIVYVCARVHTYIHKLILYNTRILIKI